MKYLVQARREINNNDINGNHHQDRVAHREWWNEHGHHLIELPSVAVDLELRGFSSITVRVRSSTQPASHSAATSYLVEWMPGTKTIYISQAQEDLSRPHSAKHR